MYIYKKRAFTLAEVLITLGIIGVVAALTMPSLIAKYKERETVVKLKKMYSVISQAYQQVLNDNGDPTNWGLTGTNAASANIVLARFTPYLKISKNCGSASGCFPNVTYKGLNNTNVVNINTSTVHTGRAILNDGMSIYFYVQSKDCNITYSGAANVCANVGVDINGFNPPNQLGKDLFDFTITTDRVVPYGIAGATGEASFETDCLTGYGWGCAAWVVTNENLDYLHCKNLSWSGKTKCN